MINLIYHFSPKDFLLFSDSCILILKFLSIINEHDCSKAFQPNIAPITVEVASCCGTVIDYLHVFIFTLKQ